MIYQDKRYQAPSVNFLFQCLGQLGCSHILSYNFTQTYFSHSDDAIAHKQFVVLDSFDHHHPAVAPHGWDHTRLQYFIDGCYKGFLQLWDQVINIGKACSSVFLNSLENIVQFYYSKVISGCALTSSALILFRPVHSIAC